MLTKLKFQILPDNQTRLGLLCGPINSTLKQIEDALNIKISNRGNNFKLKGDKINIDAGKVVIENLYNKSIDGDIISPEEVHLYLREATNFKNNSSSSLVNGSTTITIKTPKSIVIPKGKNQNKYIETIEKKDLTFGIGPAGTGKTYLAVASAIQGLVTGQVERILLVRPAVEAGEKLGFLPGDLNEKINPYLRPLYDALFEMLGYKETSNFIEKKVIEVVPLAFMRGRTLNNSFIILDEGQNTTQKQMKMFLTRFGFGSTVVVTGDITQIDLPHDTISGLMHCLDVLKGIKNVGFINFSNSDVVRHGLVQEIVEAYEKYKTSV
tara:strand:- start:9274 stop:10245 length:972 start_codon:yes stop_codon:yes gene_type:complete